MRRITFYRSLLWRYTLLLGLSMAVACGDDDDDDDADPIVGTWDSVSLSLLSCDNGTPDIDNFTCAGCVRNVFREDGTYTSMATVPGVIEESIEGTYTVSNATLTTCDLNGENCENSSLSVTAEELIISGEEQGCTLTVNFRKI